MNWNGTMQTSSALATYVALMVAFIAGLNPLEFALFSAVLLCLWLAFYSFANVASPSGTPEWPTGLVGPSLSESMAELQSLQSEINALQMQFTLQKNLRPATPDDFAE